MLLSKKSAYFVFVLFPLTMPAMEPEPRIIKLVSSIEPENQRVQVYIDSRLLPFASITRMREMQTGTYELAFPTPALQILQRALTINSSLGFLPDTAKLGIMRQLLYSPELDALIGQNPLQLLSETRELFDYLQLPNNQKIFIPAITEKIQAVAYKIWRQTGQEIEIPGIWPAYFSVEELLDRSMIKPEDVCIRNNNGNLIELNLKNCRLSSLQGINRLFKSQDSQTIRKIDLSNNQLTSLQTGEDLFFSLEVAREGALQILDLSNNKLVNLKTRLIVNGLALPKTLQEFYAQNNGLVEGPQTLSPTLKILNLSHNKLTQLPGYWGTTNLEICDLSHNSISEFPVSAYIELLPAPGGSATFLDNAPALKNINLSFNKISRFPSLFLMNSRNLETVNLSNNFLQQLPPFVRLQRSPNDPPYGVEYRDKLKLLRSFDASSNQLTILPDPFLPEAPDLQELFLQENMLEQLPRSFCVRSSGIRLIVLEHNNFRVPAGVQAVRPQLDLTTLPHIIGDAIVRGKEYYEREILPQKEAARQTELGTNYFNQGIQLFIKAHNEQKDFSQAKKNFENALTYPLSEKQRAQAQAGLANIAFFQRDCVNFLKYSEEASKQTAHLPSQSTGLSNLARLNLQGKCGVEKNYERAKQLLEQAHAADPKNYTALEYLATIYREGLGVPKNLPQAKHFYELAKDLGSKIAQTELRKIEEEEMKEAGIRATKAEGAPAKKARPE